MNEKVKQITEDLFPNFNNEIYYIERNGIDADVIEKIRKKQAPKKEHMKDLYNRYRLCEESIPIFNRTFTEDGAINNKTNNDYFGEIVRTTVGYFAGSPFSYTYSQVDKDVNNTKAISNPFRKAFSKFLGGEEVDQDVIDKNTELVKHFVLYNGMADKDVETTKMASICGYAPRLIYIDKTGETALTLLKPWEVTVLSREDATKPLYALREIEDIEVMRNGETKKVTKLEFYDNQYIYFFEDGDEGIVPDEEMLNADKGIHLMGNYVVQEHLFDYCPLQAVIQNDETLGIAESVISLIDAIDRTLSDCNSEVEAFKLAYLLITGADISDEELEKARITGTFVLPALGEVDMKYLIKEINDVFIENHINRLDKHIYRFSQTPDFSDDVFGNTTSGLAMKMKLFPLETRCVIFERKYHEANMYMFKTVASAWHKKQIDFDPLEVVIEYKRSMPCDLTYEAEVQAKLKGLISDQTRLNLASFVDDSEYEIELMEKEQEGIEPLNFEYEDEVKTTTSINKASDTAIL